MSSPSTAGDSSSWRGPWCLDLATLDKVPAPNSNTEPSPAEAEAEYLAWCAAAATKPAHAQQLLHAAAESGDIPTLLQLLVELKQAAHAVDEWGYTALHAAAAAGQENAVSLLLQHGALVNAATADAEGDRALHIATLHGHASIMALLISAGADVNTANADGTTPLHVAAQAADVPIARLLLDAGADADAADADGTTPLHIAAEAGDAPIVSLLLDAGADADAADMHEETPLHIAACEGHLQIVQQLIARGANPSTQSDARSHRGQGHGDYDAEERCALHHAVAEGHIGVVNQLLAAGSAAAAAGSGSFQKYTFHGTQGGFNLCGVDGFELLFEAVRANQPLIVTRLIAELSAQPGFKVADFSELLKEAALFGSTACTERLLAAGASGQEVMEAYLFSVYTPDDKDVVQQMMQLIGSGAISPDTAFDRGQMLLHIAAGNGMVGTVRQLLAAGASLAAKDSNGNTALHAAVKGRAHVLPVAHMLLDTARTQGASVLHAAVSAVDREGLCALALAARRNATAVMTLLLDAGAAVDAADGNGLTALHYAVSEGYSGAFHILVRAGADLQAADNDGNTVLHKSVSLPSTQLLQHALQAGARCAVNNQQQTPLHVAAKANNAEAIRLLLTFRAAVNAADAAGVTPLHHAVRHDHTASAQALLAAGASVNSVDGQGDTPLHLASRGGLAATVRLLLEHDASIGARNHQQHTPFQEAVLRGHLEVVQLLLRWAPLEPAELRAAAVLAASEASHAVGVVVYLLQQLAADQQQMREALQDIQIFMEPTEVRIDWLACCGPPDLLFLGHPARLVKMKRKRKD